MADNSENNDGKEGWFNSWLNAAKNKSTEVLEFVKKDLEEFGAAVKNEAHNVVSSAGSVMEKTLSFESPDSTVSTVKKSVSMLLGQMNTVLNPSPDDSDTETLIIENSEIHKLNKLQKALYDLQCKPETYLCDPEPNLLKQYECWLDILEPEQLSDEKIAKYVNSSEVLKKYYAKFVPDILEHQLFWKRYLFKKALLEDEMAKLQLIEKKRERELIKNEISNEEDLNWDSTHFDSDPELTEEQQTALLEQYEKERTAKSLSEEEQDKLLEQYALEQKRKQLSPKKLLADQQNVKKKHDEDNTRNNKIVEKPKNDSLMLNKNNSTASLGTPGSNSSTDDDWEKIGDIDKNNF